jgi:hypothetical protein
MAAEGHVFFTPPANDTLLFLLVAESFFVERERERNDVN